MFSSIMVEFIQNHFCMFILYKCSINSTATVLRRVCGYSNKIILAAGQKSKNKNYTRIIVV